MSDEQETALEVTAIVVNFNAGDDLREALASIARELAGRGWEGFVVDNASQDGSAAIAREFAPAVSLVVNPTNVGFGRAVNQALARARAPFVLIMNPDARLTPGALAVLEGELRREPQCAIAGPRILDPDGSVQGSARGDPDMFTGFFGRSTALRRLMPWLPASRRNVVDVNVPADAPSLAVDWLSGACVLARCEALLAEGGFDERYFLYYEDIDLAWRGRSRGWRYRFVPTSIVHHHHAATVGVGSNVHRYYSERNRLLTLVKNAPAAMATRELLRFPLSTVSYLWTEGVMPLLRGRRPRFATVALRVRSFGGASRHALYALRARRRIQQRRTVEPQLLVADLVRDRNQRRA